MTHTKINGLLRQIVAPEERGYHGWSDKTARKLAEMPVVDEPLTTASGKPRRVRKYPPIHPMTERAQADGAFPGREAVTSALRKVESWHEGATGRHGRGRPALIGALRMDPREAYAEVPQLLSAYIDSKETDSTHWEAIGDRIDNIYENLSVALCPVLHEPGNSEDLCSRIAAAVQRGKRLFFKLNLIDPTVLDVVDGKPGPGNKAATDWTVQAALMRFFHEYGPLRVKYSQMAFGEAASFLSIYADLLTRLLKIKCTPEMVLEGRIEHAGAVVGYGGYPGYYIRKYLASRSTPESLATDNPMNGYAESMSGVYVPPGASNGRLLAFDLNNASYDPAKKRSCRGRILAVPHASNYRNGVVAHKALVGDPEDVAAYPGSVIVNVSKLKIHCWQVATNALKNIGLGVHPMLAETDPAHGPCDWRYSSPVSSAPPAIKACGHEGVYHSVHYSTNTDVNKPPSEASMRQNAGLDGSIADMCLAVIAAEPVQLHVTDAIQTINESHTGDGVKVNEGLLFASADPVALDLLCARYLFKTVPVERAKNFGQGLGEGFAVEDEVPYFDREAKKILSRTALDSAVSRATLFPFCAEKGLGKTDYLVSGRDVASNRALVSLNGHLGYMHKNEFVELLTSTHYFHKWGMWWDKQAVALSYLRATDEMLGTNYYGYLKSELNGSGFDRSPRDVIDYSEMGFHGSSDAALRTWGLAYSDISQGEMPHGMFSFYQRMLKWSNRKWNTFNYDAMRVFTNSMAVVTGVSGVDAFTGEWPSFRTAEHIWYEILVKGLADYASKTGRSFEVYIPKEFAYLVPTVKGLVVLDDKDPGFAENVFTAKFCDQQKESWK